LDIVVEALNLRKASTYTGQHNTEKCEHASTKVPNCDPSFRVAKDSAVTLIDLPGTAMTENGATVVRT
jgi:hypothetical protein